MRRAVMLTVAIALCCAAAGDEPKPAEPKSPLARQAKRNLEFQMKLITAKRDGVIERAHEEYGREKKQHLAEYRKRMQDALSVALKNEQLEEASRIKVAIESLKQQPEEKPAESDSFNIAGTWTIVWGSGRPNEHYRIEQDGSFTNLAGRRLTGKLTSIDGQFLQTLNRGWINRLTPAGSKLMVEQFVGDKADESKLQHVGVATRGNGVK